MKLTFRFDDFSASPPVTGPTTYRVLDVFLKSRVPLLAGIIPCAVESCHDLNDTGFHRLEENQEGLALLREGLTQGWQLAMHGYTHQRTAETEYTEFAGQSLPEQRSKLEKGLEIMHTCFPAIPIEIFIPPWNSYDGPTLQCLEESAFRILCAGQARFDIRSLRIEVVPSALNLKEFLLYVNHYSIKELARVLGNGWLVITIHEYDFDASTGETHVPLSALQNLFDRLRAESVEPSILPIGERVVPLGSRQMALLKARLHLIEIRNGWFSPWISAVAEKMGLQSVLNGLLHSHSLAFGICKITRAASRLKAH